MRQPSSRPPLTPAAEDCLKAVLKLQRRGGRVATNDLAAELDVSAPTVTVMIKRLAGHELLDHQRYHGVLLTETGRAMALEVVRHHRLLEAYLVQRLGVELDAAHAEACRLEHALSEELEARIADELGHPTHDPHGDPIPDHDLRVEDTRGTTLADLAAGQSCRVARIPDSDPALVRYLDELGLVPGATVTITTAAPFDGPITLALGSEHVTLPAAIARSIGVTAR